MNKPLETLQILSHARHDWLNHIQLIDGYLSLKQPDKAREVIKRVIAQSQNESEMMKLQAPAFAEKVLTFNWFHHAFSLSFEASVEDIWTDSDALLCACFDAFTSMMDRHSQSGADQDMELMIQDSVDKQVTFHFQGVLLINDRFLKETEQFLATYSSTVDEWSLSEQECSFVLKPERDGTNT
ncbi:sporulation initiation phosphotransferase B [Salisediminibacterium selenitireducens]|uniref:Sporulation initiation phosphotransferase B C-terminal domain-containing protein n=1 Tax=Bacillus selenitireducens (strain ATCC 700615 / DSM 15326 / MLS10) TaxID=439292 RepID=D6XX00_BACIE|nr:sporulation initiation phosphotransferase B [Salisediminibacterium selenitireducens]ADH99976.1 hypothetical protein Bsel_2475 [[Bacillus] selenitireducens MLS10]